MRQHIDEQIPKHVPMNNFSMLFKMVKISQRHV